MNGYLTAALSTMLGWVRGLASSVWQLVSGENTGTFLRFIAEHWKGILLVLCIVGVLADFAVYLLRWRPYKVWSSFLRRLREGRPSGEDEAAEEPPAPQVLLPAPEEAETPPQLPAGTRRRRRAYFAENRPQEAEAEQRFLPEEPPVPGEPEETRLYGTEADNPPPRRRRRRNPG